MTRSEERKDVVICHVKKPRQKTHEFTWEKGTIIVIAQNRRTGGVGEDVDSREGKERKGGVGRERKEQRRK